MSRVIFSSVFELNFTAKVFKNLPYVFCKMIILSRHTWGSKIGQKVSRIIWMTPKQSKNSDWKVLNRKIMFFIEKVWVRTRLFAFFSQLFQRNCTKQKLQILKKLPNKPTHSVLFNNGANFMANKTNYYFAFFSSDLFKVTVNFFVLIAKLMFIILQSKNLI